MAAWTLHVRRRTRWRVHGTASRAEGACSQGCAEPARHAPGMPCMSIMGGAAGGAVKRVSTMPSPSIMACVGSRSRGQARSRMTEADPYKQRGCATQSATGSGNLVGADQQDAASEGRLGRRGGPRSEGQETARERTSADGVPGVLLHAGAELSAHDWLRCSACLPAVLGCRQHAMGVPWCSQGGPRVRRTAC